MANPSHDGLYDKAVMIVRASKRASIPLLQRHLRIGYNRAARLMEAMGQAGIVVPLQTGWVMPDDATPPSPSTAPVVDERAAFESWAGPREFDLRRPHKTYHNTCTDYAWMGWQARAALASRPAEVDEAWVLLFEALPHIPPQAVNPGIARVGPIEDAYINTRIRKYLERVAAPSHTTNKEK